MADSAVTIPQSQSVQPAVPPVENDTSADRPVNVGDLERWLSLFGGSALALYSLRRSLGSFLLLFGAGALIYRGITGHCSLYQQMEISSAPQDERRDYQDAIPGPDDTPRIVIASS